MKTLAKASAPHASVLLRISHLMLLIHCRINGGCARDSGQGSDAGVHARSSAAAACMLPLCFQVSLVVPTWLSKNPKELVCLKENIINQTNKKQWCLAEAGLIVLKYLVA